MINKYVVLLSALLISANSHAVEVEAGAADHGYILGSLGLVSVKDFCEDNAVVGASTVCDDKTYGVKIGGGYRLTDNFAVELAANFTGDVETSIYDSFDRIDGSVSARILTAQAVVRAPIGKANILFKAGFARSSIDADVTFSGSSFGSGSVSESATSTSPILSVGFEFPIKNKVGLFVQYDLITDVGDKDSVGESDIGFLNAGISLGF